MLVFGTQMHMVTFIFVSVELVIFLYLIIFRLARPGDDTALLNLALIFLLLIYNVTGALLPDPRLPGSYFLQVSVAYSTGFITPCYFPFYAYKAFGLEKLKFHAYKGVFLFLILPYFLFVIVFAYSGDLKTAKNLLVLPVIYAMFFIMLVYRAVQHKYRNDLDSNEAKQEVVVILLSCMTLYIQKRTQRWLKACFQSIQPSATIYRLDKAKYLLVLADIQKYLDKKIEDDELKRLIDQNAGNSEDWEKISRRHREILTQDDV